jgi:hypothetical protein
MIKKQIVSRRWIINLIVFKKFYYNISRLRLILVKYTIIIFKKGNYISIMFNKYQIDF